uniref:Large ribosomal subunit protein eL24 n=1 Tax=Salmo salar TaxID=8030 RepID=B5X5Z1_SALSA|nr:60S ribosomal protein L24 [Salmo salar]
MRFGLCNVTGYKIFPGRGRTYVKADGKGYHLLNKRAEHLFWLKTNPRSVRWTVLCRRMLKKGVNEEVRRKKTKKTVRVQRAVEGNTLESILSRKNQSAAFRKEQRDQATKKSNALRTATKNENKAKRESVRATIAKNIPSKNTKGASNKPLGGKGVRR